MGTKLWPHQIAGLRQLWALLQAGEKRICLTSPTGGGKTRMLSEIIGECQHQGLKTALYTNRIMLTSQTSGVFADAGLEHGIRAAGFDEALLRGTQICSIMTEYSRCVRRKSRSLHKSDVVFVDEAHAIRSVVATHILNQHIAEGAAIVGVTATPLGLGHLYNKLVVAGTNSELRACGALLPCVTYGPDEPDLSHVRRDQVGEFVQGDVVRAINRNVLFGRVEKWWRRLNPDAKPTLLFAPGVSESKWFVENFEKAGITAAHIDGKHIFTGGREYQSSPELRAEVLQASKQGDIKIVCNRFVLREGLDMPWLYCCIMATPFGSIKSYLQAGGRLLRNFKGLDHTLLIDHGGNWWRHGSLNEDRQWDLSMDPLTYMSTRAKKRAEEGVPEPICCTVCGGIRLGGYKCPFCGHECALRYKNVIQVDGTLKRMTAVHYKKAKKKKQFTTDQKLWYGTYFAILNMSRRESRLGADTKKYTMRMVSALFAKKAGHYPSVEVRGVPKTEAQWSMQIETYQRKVGGYKG